MRGVALPILLCSLMCSAISAWAAPQLKPGLWEISTKSDALKNMPQLPAEQIEQMRQMGIDLPQMKNGIVASKICISKEMAQRDSFPDMQQKELGCATKNFHKTAVGYSADIACNSSKIKGVGHLNGSMSGNESFSSTYDFKGTAYGEPVDQHHESTGKWLSADCGSIKPMDALSDNK